MDNVQSGIKGILSHHEEVRAMSEHVVVYKVSVSGGWEEYTEVGFYHDKEGALQAVRDLHEVAKLARKWHRRLPDRFHETVCDSYSPDKNGGCSGLTPGFRSCGAGVYEIACDDWSPWDLEGARELRERERAAG